MTEAEARATLAAFDAIGGMVRWIAAQPWLAAPGGVRVVASGGGGEPAGASRRCGSCRGGGGSASNERG